MLSIDSYLIHPRLEQPASSLLWLFPELTALWKLISLQKVHSWMRCFGHALPKPSVFVGNINMEIMQQLYRKWSKRMEEQWRRTWHVLRFFVGVKFIFLFGLKRTSGKSKVCFALDFNSLGMMTSVLRQSPALQLLWKRKVQFCRTALKWRARYKVKMATYEKCYYKIHRSKSNRRKFVTGGPKLKDSGIYTEKFCLAVVKMWDTACAAKMNGFANSTSTQVHYTKLWKDMLATSKIQKDPGSLLQQVLFSQCLNPKGLFSKGARKNPNNRPCQDDGKISTSVRYTLGRLQMALSVLDD